MTNRSPTQHRSSQAISHLVGTSVTTNPARSPQHVPIRLAERLRSTRFSLRTSPFFHHVAHGQAFADGVGVVTLPAPVEHQAAASLPCRGERDVASDDEVPRCGGNVTVQRNV